MIRSSFFPEIIETGTYFMDEIISIFEDIKITQ